MLRGSPAGCSRRSARAKARLRAWSSSGVARSTGGRRGSLASSVRARWSSRRPATSAEIERFAARTQGHERGGRGADRRARAGSRRALPKGAVLSWRGPPRSARRNARARRRAPPPGRRHALRRRRRGARSRGRGRHRLPGLRRAPSSAATARRARRDDPGAHARSLAHASGAAPPSALSPLCRAAGGPRIHDRGDDDRKREEGRASACARRSSS